MAATSRGIVSSGMLQQSRSRPGSSTKTRTRDRVEMGGFTMQSTRTFRSLRTIQKQSPRLTRSRSHLRLRTTKAFGGDQMNWNSGWKSNYFASKSIPQEDDVMRAFDSENDESDDENSNSNSSGILDTVNAVLADIVDGQKYLKETGRREPRPMKRRAMVVSLALGGLRGPLNDVESRIGSMRRSASASRMSRTPSWSGFAQTAHLISQLSFGSPHGTEMHQEMH